MVNVVGRWAGATPVNAATGSSPKSTAPISHTLNSARAPPPQLGREVGPNLPQQQSVRSVNRTVCQSLCSVPVRGDVSLDLRLLVGEGPPPVVVSSSLVSPLRPTELCNHPDSCGLLRYGRPEAWFSDWVFSLFLCAQIFLYKYAVCVSAAVSDRRLSSN